MEKSKLGITIYHAGYVCTKNLFKTANLLDERKANYYELVIFLSDGGYFMVNDKKYMITAGSCRLLRRGDRVSSYKFGDVYSVHFRMEDETKNEDFLQSIPTFFSLSDLDEPINMVKALSASLLEENSFDSFYKLFELISYMKSHILPRHSKDGTIASVKKYIDAHYSKHITLEFLSEKFYLHPVYLQRRFKREYGCSPTEYMMRLRMNYAKKDLVFTNLTIEEISYKVGFAYPSYFIRVFKKFEDCTPLQYRQAAVNSIELDI